LIKTAALALVVSVAAQAQASTFNLSTDFSDSVNPNGAWSFTQGTTLLTHFATQVACQHAQFGSDKWLLGCWT
jgi:hypothetical protein